ncbi:MAG: hypothetical protein OJF61_002730 [Rhodanobacteraceae bacterium]|jgi:hypothetical protein|nr:MAG: hypothetical protein OJF61_002730 [Rhodanobacteraceae bacterium]
MRSWIRIVAVLAACLGLAACQRAPDLSKLGSPAHRLVGHWATSDGNEEFFAPVDASGKGEFTAMQSGGKPARQRYRVLDEEPATQTVHITMLDGNGAEGDPRTITLAEDGESATVTQGNSSVALALARMDDAATPEQSAYVLPPPSAGTSSPRNARYAEAGGDRPPANPSFGPPTNASDGVYRYVLIGYDGLTPLYAWKRVSDVSGQHVDDNAVAYSRGMARRHDYVIWLNAVAFAFMLVTTLLFRKNIDEKFLLGSWLIVIAIGLLGVFVFNVPIIAGLVEIGIAFVLAVRGLFPKSDMLA